MGLAGSLQLYWNTMSSFSPSWGNVHTCTLGKLSKFCIACFLLLVNMWVETGQMGIQWFSFYIHFAVLSWRWIDNEIIAFLIQGIKAKSWYCLKKRSSSRFCRRYRRLPWEPPIHTGLGGREAVWDWGPNCNPLAWHIFFQYKSKWRIRK